jgi:MoaE-MoaD fusion protein
MKKNQPTVTIITEEEISLEALVKQITLPSTGAVVVFTGVVREISSGAAAFKTKSLEYEAYRPMAEEKMRQVVDEMRERWQEVEGIVLVQRVGKMDAGAVTTVVACAAAHRGSGVFEAARYGIDRMKEIVPVWKKEIGPEGDAWVEGHYHPRPGE